MSIGSFICTFGEVGVIQIFTFGEVGVMQTFSCLIFMRSIVIFSWLDLKVSDILV
jgi:hypothetical protein